MGDPFPYHPSIPFSLQDCLLLVMPFPLWWADPGSPWRPPHNHEWWLLPQAKQATLWMPCLVVLRGRPRAQCGASPVVLTSQNSSYSLRDIQPGKAFPCLGRLNLDTCDSPFQALGQPCRSPFQSSGPSSFLLSFSYRV